MTASELNPEAARPLCPTHPQVTSVGTCERCGRFMCSDCQTENDVCIDCRRKQLAEVPRSAGRATLAVAFLAIAAAAEGASLLFCVLRLLAGGTGEVVEALSALADIGVALGLIGAGIVYLRWLHLSVRQVIALGHDVGISPGRAVAAWFLPFVNFVRPYNVLRNLAGVVGGESLIAAVKLRVWWALWLAGSALGYVESKMAVSSADTSAPYVVGLLANAASLGAALLCIRHVRLIQGDLDRMRQACEQP